MTEPIDIAVLTFAADPRGWFDWVRSEILSGRWQLILPTIGPAQWSNEAGRSWRIVRTVDGIEIRPELENPFIHYGDSPKVTAVGIGPSTVSVELTCFSGRWVDRFPLGAFNVAALGQTMLDERALPHDNLPALFPEESR